MSTIAVYSDEQNKIEAETRVLIVLGFRSGRLDLDLGHSLDLDLILATRLLNYIYHYRPVNQCEIGSNLSGSCRHNITINVDGRRRKW